MRTEGAILGELMAVLSLVRKPGALLIVCVDIRELPSAVGKIS